MEFFQSAKAIVKLISAFSYETSHSHVAFVSRPVTDGVVCDSNIELLDTCRWWNLKIMQVRLIHLPIATSNWDCGDRRHFFNKKYYRKKMWQSLKKRLEIFFENRMQAFSEKRSRISEVRNRTIA